MTEPSDRAQIRVLPPVIPLLGMTPGFALQDFWPVGFLSLEVGVWLGRGLLVFAIALALAAVWRLKRANTGVDPRKTTTRLVTDGVFSVTRNPIYVAMTLFVVGVACYGNSLWVLLCAAPIGYALQKCAIEPEERYLAAKFGKAYLDYTARVRRWV